MGDVRLTAVIVAQDEGHCIGRCLRSIAPITDEIIVLDSGSHDDTVEIARTFGAKVYSVDWPGFGPQKNRALRRATGEWILSIDADEHLTPELASSIREIVRSPNRTANGYFIRYQNTWCGQHLRFGDWANKRHVRLFHHASAHFTDDTVHERVVCDEPYGVLDGFLIHDTVATESEADEKCLRYAALRAQVLAKIERGGLWSASTHGAWTFLRGYLLKGGFLDGVAGWKLAAVNAKGTWLAYRLAGLQLAKARPNLITAKGLVGVASLVMALVFLALVIVQIKSQSYDGASIDTDVSSQSRQAPVHHVPP